MRIHELGHVVLYVTDLEKVADFYRDSLGDFFGGIPASKNRVGNEHISDANWP